MADHSPTPQSGQPASKQGRDDKSHAVMSQEQIRAIADRVYTMLLRDLKYEQERDRMVGLRFGRLKGGR